MATPRLNPYVFVALLLTVGCESRTSKSPVQEAAPAAERAPTTSKTSLERVALPGLSVELPKWDVEEDGSSFGMGRHVRKERNSSNLVQVYWVTARDVTGDELAGIMSAVSEGQSQEIVRWESLVADHSAKSLIFTVDSQKTAVTTWECPNDHRSMHIMTSLPNASVDEVREFHDQIMTNVQCHLEAHRPEAKRISFDAPSGFVEAVTPTETGYEHPDGRFYSYTVGTSGRKLASDFNQDSRLRQVLVQTIFGDPQAEISEEPEEFVGGGRSRPTYRAEVVFEGTEYFLLMSGWHCEEADVSFVGVYGSLSEKSLREGGQGLASASCPPLQ